MKHEDLIVWQKSMILVKEIYQESKNFPADERFGLTSQIRRSAVSIPSNIAEGHGRKSTKAYINHLSIAFGSLMELETLLKILAEVRLFIENKVTKIFNENERGWKNAKWANLVFTEK